MSAADWDPVQIYWDDEEGKAVVRKYVDKVEPYTHKVEWHNRFVYILTHGAENIKIVNEIYGIKE